LDWSSKDVTLTRSNPDILPSEIQSEVNTLKMVKCKGGFAFLQFLPNLTALVSDLPVLHDQGRELEVLAKHAKQLRKLSLSFLYNLYLKNGYWLIRDLPSVGDPLVGFGGLASLTNLTDLTLDVYRVVDGQYNDMFEAVGSLQNLKSLSLKTRPLGRVERSAFLTCLGALRLLETLRLENTLPQPEGRDNILKYRESDWNGIGLRALQELRLKVPYSSLELFHFLRSLRWMSELRTFEFSILDCESHSSDLLTNIYRVAGLTRLTLFGIPPELWTRQDHYLPNLVLLRGRVRKQAKELELHFPFAKVVEVRN